MAFFDTILLHVLDLSGIFSEDRRVNGYRPQCGRVLINDTTDVYMIVLLFCSINGHKTLIMYVIYRQYEEDFEKIILASLFEYAC